jgi:hypothetical protein
MTTHLVYTLPTKVSAPSESVLGCCDPSNANTGPNCDMPAALVLASVVMLGYRLILKFKRPEEAETRKSARAFADPRIRVGTWSELWDSQAQVRLYLMQGATVHLGSKCQVNIQICPSIPFLVCNISTYLHRVKLKNRARESSLNGTPVAIA